VIDADAHGRTDLTPGLLRQERIWGVLVALDDNCPVPAGLLFECQMSGIRVFDQNSFWEREACCIDIDSHESKWLRSGEGFRHGKIELVRRRVFDLVIATIVLVLALPLLLIVAALVKLDSRGPVFYRQERIGRKGHPFILYKFRSMRADAELGGVPQWAAIGDSRVTRVGKYIRYTRIDEIPQLINVLRGEMSVIGPRPERPYFVEQLTAEIPLYCFRHFVKPGITGWAQINAPYGASIDDARRKLRFDLYYIKHCGLKLDLLILLRTLRVILFQEGAR